MTTFLSLEEFNSKVEEQQQSQSDIMKFRDLEVNVVYLISGIDEISTTHGEATILTLKKEKEMKFGQLVF